MKKIAVSFPPLESPKGVPLLTQNRQFQWFNAPTYIYPMVPASLATLLKSLGYEVFWDDGIAEELNYSAWFDRLVSEKPDMIVLESKTPVIKKHWKIIDELKKKLPDTRCVLCGDHVTANPLESLENSKVDYVLIGGHYDVLCKYLVENLNDNKPFEKGIAYRKDNVPVSTGLGDFDFELEDLPLIDRKLTKWELYSVKNGNYKYTPGTYTMFGRDCWWRKAGGCTFCSWTSTYPKFQVVSAKKALVEVEELVALGVKEIFDDTGTFPTGKWLKEFCEGIIERGLNKRVTLGCNMRPDALSLDEYKLMKKAGFRLVLFGLESGNQNTLDRVNKGSTVEDIVAGLKRASKAGLEVHITTMIGYPWETKDDAERTINLAKDLFNGGSVSTLQATVVIPYPGTRLYNECKENGWLLFTDYDRFDQREQVMKSELTTEDVLRLTQGLYKSFLTPRFILRKLLSVRSFKDVKYYMMAAGRVIGHLKDFSHRS